MRVDFAKYVASCGICQKVKSEHQRLAGLLKPLEIPMWKCENITMDFVVGLPHFPRGKDVIWDVIDRLTKVAHFIPMKTINSASDLVPLYSKEVVRLHGVPKSIVSDHDSKLFLEKFAWCFGHWIGSQHCFSPSDGWSVKAYYSDTRRLVAILCPLLEG